MKRKSTWHHHLFNFLAVILGVYLAFFINEKAQLNKQKAEVKKMMQSIVSELESDIEIYENYHLPKQEKFKNQLLDLIPLCHRDSLVPLTENLPIILEVDNYLPNTATYSSLKSSGKFNLIQNIEVIQKLSSYYEGSAAETIAKSDFQVDFFSTYLLPWCMQHVAIENFEITTTDQLPQLKNYILVYQSLVEQKTASYKILTREAKALIAQIQAEIDN